MKNTEKRGQYPYEYEKRRALEAFKNHEITVESEDGVNRVIRLSAPNTSTYSFRITTWAGHLAVSGDIGSYMFRREYDMFGFFASNADHASMSLKINPQYWVEKCEATCNRSAADALDEDEFKSYLLRYFKEIPHDNFVKGGRLQAWRAIRDEMIEYMPDTPDDAVRSAMDYEIDWGCLDGGESIRPFEEAWDHGFKQPSFSLLFSCYAIIFGIKKYAQLKEGRDQVGHDRKVLEGAL